DIINVTNSNCLYSKSQRVSATAMTRQTQQSPANNSTPLQPNAVLAVDVVVFTVRLAVRMTDAWQVLIVRSSKPAFGGKRALPGVLVRNDETFEQAARRALRTKTGLDATDWYLEQLATYGDPGRDTRGRVTSIAHMALVLSDDLSVVPGGTVVSARWVPVRKAIQEELAFDHSDML